ncbi:Uncharacterised protein [Legionella quateirensis]|uniref:Uncharacterized protein n=3 Tax=Legionella quateirensis TaxID=45072 RepID=A0A378KX24_9GAMM|nr:hypothetical protein [Legionella quateirensis]STY19083.1 Uncharacterised protein [Legionella quateirensis]
MSKKLTDSIKQEMHKVMRTKCDTSDFGVRDAITFFGCIPGVNTNVTDIKNKFHEQPPHVLKVIERCRKAEEAIQEDRDYKKQGPRKGQGIEHPLTHKEVLVRESMEKTAQVVQSDKAGVCHTLAQFAFVNLMKECTLNGRAFDDGDPSEIPSIRIVAHNPQSNGANARLRAAGTHNFIIVGFDDDYDLTYEQIEEEKENILIIDPWYFALGNEGSKWGHGIYTWDEYPKGFLHNLSCTYDNQKPFTQEDLEAARELSQTQRKESFKAIKMDWQSVKQVKTLEESLNTMKAKLANLEDEYMTLSDDSGDDWDLEDDDMSEHDKMEKMKSLNLEIASLKERINTTRTNMDNLTQNDEQEACTELQMS